MPVFLAGRTDRKSKEQFDAGEDILVIVTEKHSGWSNGWAARVSKGDTPGAFKRSFLEATESNLSNAGNGIKQFRLVDMEGYYETDSVSGSYKSVRQYFKCSSGESITKFDSKNEMMADMFGCQSVADYLKLVAENEAAYLAETSKRLGIEGFSKLSGSERQIPWAESIRSGFFEGLIKLNNKAQQEYDDLLALLRAREIAIQDSDDLVFQAWSKLERCKKIAAAAAAKDSAKFWIDNRFLDFQSLARMLERAG